MSAARLLHKNDGTGIHDAFHRLLRTDSDNAQPMLCQGLESRGQAVQPVRKRLVTGQRGKPFRQMLFGVVVNRLLLKPPLADPPQVYRYTLLITKFGTEIVALTLHYCFDYATIVADGAIELYEVCLPHTYILCSFALFVYLFSLFSTLDSHKMPFSIEMQAPKVESSSSCNKPGFYGSGTSLWHRSELHFHCNGRGQKKKKLVSLHPKFE